jgi:mannosyltransferase
MKDETAPRTRSPWLAAALVGALSAVLGAITLSHKSLWYDEAYNGVKVAGSWHGVFTAIGKTEMSQSAYLVLLKPWIAITTNNEVWLRLPSVIAAALAAALLVPLGARLFDRTTGIVAGILLATNELLVAWSQQARAYALVTFAVVLASLLFVRALDGRRRRGAPPSSAAGLRCRSCSRFSCPSTSRSSSPGTRS